MSELTAAQAQAYRQRWQAVAEVEAEEAKAKTIEQRWLELNAIYRMAVALGLPLEQDSSEEVVYQRWAKLRKKVTHATQRDRATPGTVDGRPTNSGSL
jgi:hypothetical protein